MPEEIDILIHKGLIVTQDPEHHIYHDCDLAIKGERILAIGKALPYTAKKVIDGQRKLVMPGLVDPHMHETITRGICEDLPLDRWLEEICFPLDKQQSWEVMYAAGLMNQLEMIRGGITTFIDIYQYPDACAQVALISGLRGIYVPQIILDPPGAGETIESAEEFVKKWKGVSPLIMPGFGPHAPYSNTIEDYQKVGELAEKFDVPIHTHLSETQWEVGIIRERYGCTATEMLLKAGVLSPRLSVAHGVYLTDSDVDLLVAHGVGLAYNPTSNMKLASGIARIPDYQARGLVVGVGTDSNLSNNNLDMFEEMRLGAMLQKMGRNDPSAMPVRLMLDMATIHAAKVLGLDKEVGSLEVGKQADVILLDLNHPHLWPMVSGIRSNIEEQIVYSANAGDVSHTIVAGKVLMEDGVVLTLDTEEAYEIVNSTNDKFLKRAGLL